jgi:hypothetical protein
MGLLCSGILVSCEFFDNSMVGYSLDNIEIARVTGLTVKTEYAMMGDDTILVPPGTAKIGAMLSNPRNFTVKKQLLGVPEGKNITANQISPAEIEVYIDGAAEGDDYALTLAMQSPDGLRDFPAYPLRIKCVSFETALQDFTVNGVVPPAFDPVKNAFQVDLPYTSTTVTLGATTVHPGAVIEIYAGTDDSGMVLTKAPYTTEITQDLALGNNYFYVKITAPSSSVQGYAVTVCRAMDLEKAITGFYFTIGSKQYGVGTGITPEDGSGSINGSDITVAVPYGTDVTNLIPVIDHTGKAISPDAGTPQDFTNPVIYTVTAEDGSTQSYTVTVTVPLNTAKAITAFSIISPVSADGTIDETLKTITVTVPYGTDVTVMTASVSHTGALIDPDPAAPGSYAAPVPYTVTAEDGSTAAYTVTVTVALNTAKEITAFAIDSPSAVGTINETAKTITVTVPYGTNVTAMTATVSHTGAFIDPDPAAPGNYAVPVPYTVTAADGSTATYTVTVNAAPGLTIGGITVAGLNGLTFSNVPTMPVAVNTPITITISGGTPTDWYIEVIGPASAIHNATNSFAAPGTPGFYNINVIATVGGVDYSGSFGLVVY